MPDMKKGLPYTFKTYKVGQSKSKCHLLTQSSLTSKKCLTSFYPRMWTSPSLSHPSICNWRWEMYSNLKVILPLFVFQVPLFQNDLFSGARICQPLPRLQSWREGRRGTICLQQTISSDVLNIIVSSFET